MLSVPHSHVWQLPRPFIGASSCRYFPALLRRKLHSPSGRKDLSGATLAFYCFSVWNALRRRAQRVRSGAGMPACKRSPRSIESGGSSGLNSCSSPFTSASEGIHASPTPLSRTPSARASGSYTANHWTDPEQLTIHQPNRYSPTSANSLFNWRFFGSHQS